MENKTVQYKRTLRGSVGAGVSALLNGNGRRYYILEHKNASKYHKAGESQKIIIDQVELGRDPNCQVRFDDSFETVSRRHAAIVKDGDRWKLVQLSKTNSTLLNGRLIENEWYLENGDEIQLSVDGPRMGFIVPAGNQSLVSSIKMTERLELFRKQALKPYKTAIACLAVLLVVVACVSSICIHRQGKIIGGLQDLVAELTEKIQINEDIIDSLKNLPAPKSEKIVVVKPPVLKDNISNYENDVYFIVTEKVVVTNDKDINEEIGLIGWTGTGFLTSTGQFITAKHCVEGWKIENTMLEIVRKNLEKTRIEEEDDEETIAKKNELQEMIINQLKAFSLGVTHTAGLRVVAYFSAHSKSGNSLRFTSDDFNMDHSTEQSKLFLDSFPWVFEQSSYTDWACVKNVGKTGKIVVDQNLSANLAMGTDLHILGFPFGMGATDTKSLHPLYGSAKTSQEGLDNGIIRIGARNYESGNSGGPVFVMTDNGLRAVGIVSYSVGVSQGGFVPLITVK